MGMLAESVDHVIGVDTHRDSHTAAVLDRTGSVLARGDQGGNAGRCSAWVHGCGSATAEVLRKGTFSTPGRSYVQGANGVGDLG